MQRIKDNKEREKGNTDQTFTNESLFWQVMKVMKEREKKKEKKREQKKRKYKSKGL